MHGAAGRCAVAGTDDSRRLRGPCRHRQRARARPAELSTALRRRRALPRVGQRYLARRPGLWNRRLLLSDLAVSSQLVVVERLQVDAILRELNRRASGRVDTTSAPRLGRLLGARQIVAGQIAIQPDDRLRLDGRVANTITGSINPAVSNASTLNNVLDAEKQLAFALFDRLQVSLTPAERARVDRRATRSIAALLAYSRGVRDEVGGDFPAAMREYQDAVRRDPAFRQAGARLNDVSSRLAAPAIAALSPLARVTALAADALNRPLIVTPAADPAFTAMSRIVTIIITVDIP